MPKCKKCGEEKVKRIVSEVAWETIKKRLPVYQCFTCDAAKERQKRARAAEKLREKRARDAAEREKLDYAETKNQGRKVARHKVFGAREYKKTIPPEWAATQAGVKPPKPDISGLEGKNCKRHGVPKDRALGWSVSHDYPLGRWRVKWTCPVCMADFKQGNRVSEKEWRLDSHIKDGVMTQIQADFCAGRIWPTDNQRRNYLNRDVI